MRYAAFPAPWAVAITMSLRDAVGRLDREVVSFAISQISVGCVGSTTVIAKLSELLFVEQSATTSPMQYPTCWRLHLAAQQLKETRGTIAQIGHAAGHESEAAFSRAFKRQYAVSPAAWRRQAG